MTQEGTSANVGTKEQVEFDFGEVIRPLALIDIDHPLIVDLHKWRVSLLGFLDGDLSSVQLGEVGEIVSTTLAFVAAMNRPMLLRRFGIYAAPILTREELEEYVFCPQIKYDFGQLELLTDDPDVIAEIRLYCELNLASETLPSDDDISLSVMNLVTMLHTRPLLQERLYGRLMSLIVSPVDFDLSPPADKTLASVTGGLSATLLDPPPV